MSKISLPIYFDYNASTPVHKEVLKAREERILNFAADSFPFRSEIGLLSAKPNFFAFTITSENFFLLLSIDDKIKFVVPLRIPN